MKGIICVLVLVLNYTSFSQSYPHLFELRGLEDSLVNTHLFYRYGYPQYFNCWSKSIYHYNISANIDTLFIIDSGGESYPGYGCEGQYIYDYEFFDNDPAKYIYGGYDLWFDPLPILIRYNGEIPVHYIGGITEIEIAEKNDSLVYAALQGALLKSRDGGYTFNFIDSIPSIDNSMISLSKNNDSQIYGIDDNKLVRSEDEGRSYLIVDNSYWDNFSELFYDPDGIHIYGLYNHRYYFTQETYSKFYVSNDNGNPFTWTNLLTKNLPIRFTHDEIQSSEVYYALKRNIYKSTDFANTFEHYKKLDRNITGLYKKSGTGILYASTPLKIYEISPDTIQLVKILPIPDEVFQYYPLTVGNKWFYSQIAQDFWSGEVTITYFIREVTGDTIMSNNQKYKKLLEYDAYLNTEFTFYERIDSSSGLVYRYAQDSMQSNNEFLIEDLLSEIGDTVTSYRISHYSPWIVNKLIHYKVDIFSDFNLTRDRKVYSESTSLQFIRQSLTKGIGLDSMIINPLDWYTSFVDLEGCIINGTVYGDTTVVSVEDEQRIIPFEFELTQNYPNPFNSTTKIRYKIAGYPPGAYPANILPPKTEIYSVSLIIYDILGNEITTLVNEEKPAGSYEVEFNGNELPSGIYFYQLTTGSYIETKKMVLMK